MSFVYYLVWVALLIPIKKIIKSNIANMPNIANIKNIIKSCVI